MDPEKEITRKRQEAAAKAQYEHLLIGKKWEDESSEVRAQWIGSLSVALDAADEAMIKDPELLSFIAQLVGSIKFPDKDWKFLQPETKRHLRNCAATVISATQGK